jgi:hypothetical protein
MRARALLRLVRDALNGGAHLMDSRGWVTGHQLTVADVADLVRVGPLGLDYLADPSDSAVAPPAEAA